MLLIATLYACSPSAIFSALRFGRIVQARRRAMGIDVIDVLRLDARVFQGSVIAPRRRLAGLVRRHLVKRVAGEGEAEHLAIDARAPVGRVLDRFEHQHPGALAGHEAVAITVERPAGLLGCVVARARARGWS